MKMDKVSELVLQSLEHEMGGVRIYEAAVGCAVNDELREEWEEYLEQTRKHVRVLEGVCSVMGLDPEQETPGRDVVRTVGAALLAAMGKAQAAGDPAAAEVVACECVTLAETKDHLDWELIGKVAGKVTGKAGKALKEAYEQVEDEEDEHLYHTKGWCRELWLQALGLPAVLPPPEEEHHVTTAIGAARAEKASERSR